MQDSDSYPAGKGAEFKLGAINGWRRFQLRDTKRCKCPRSREVHLIKYTYLGVKNYIHFNNKVIHSRMTMHDIK